MKKLLSTKQVTPYLKGSVLLFVLTLLLGCSSDSDDPLPPNPEPKPTTKPEPEPIVGGSRGNREVSEALQKGNVWKTECIPQKKGGGILIWSFTLTDFSLKADIYSDSTCTNIDSENSPEGVSGTYEVGSDEITSPEGYQAWEIDFTAPDGSVTEQSLVALSDDISKMLMPIPETTTRPSDFSDAVEYTSGGNENGEGTPKNLEGRWGTDCIDTGDGKSGFLGYDFKKNQFTETIIIYSDANCKKEDKRGDFKGKTVIGKTLTTDDGFTATELDLKFDNGDLEKLLYATAKPESGRDVIVVSRTTENGNRPTNLEPAIGYYELDDSKHSMKSSEKDPEFSRNIEIQGHFFASESTLELKDKLNRNADISENSSKDFSRKLQELRNLFPNQEGLRSGNW